MALYVVLEPSGLSHVETREQAVLVRDGFHFFAFLLPAVWFFWNRMWIEALGAILVAFAIGAVAAWLGPPEAGMMLSLAAAILFGFEASGLRIASYRRAGYHEWGSVEAANAREAELRYASEASERPDHPHVDRWDAPDTAPRAVDGEVGLVSYPWSR